MDTHVTNPHCFRLPGHISPGAFGFSQEWYPGKWQRVSGCGPTTAAMLYHYITCNSSYFPDPPIATQEDAVHLMQAFWQQMTPGALGLFNPHTFIRGFTRFGAAHGYTFTAQKLLCHARRRDVSRVLDFIQTGLNNDCPVAFLNLHSNVQSISSWHWMPIVGLSRQSQSCAATVLDYGYRRTVPLVQWLQHFPTVGAFIWFRQHS